MLWACLSVPHEVIAHAKQCTVCTSNAEAHHGAVSWHSHGAAATGPNSTMSCIGLPCNSTMPLHRSQGSSCSKTKCFHEHHMKAWCLTATTSDHRLSSRLVGACRCAKHGLAIRPSCGGPLHPVCGPLTSPPAQGATAQPGPAPRAAGCGAVMGEMVG